MIPTSSEEFRSAVTIGIVPKTAAAAPEPRFPSRPEMIDAARRPTERALTPLCVLPFLDRAECDFMEFTAENRRLISLQGRKIYTVT